MRLLVGGWSHAFFLSRLEVALFLPYDSLPFCSQLCYLDWETIQGECRKDEVIFRVRHVYMSRPGSAITM